MAFKSTEEILREHRQKQGADNGGKSHEWPAPHPLPDSLLPVDAFSSEFLPAAIGPWIDDIAERLQCPPDYVAVAAITALGSVIGRRIGVRPQQRTDWTEIANLWGAFIGRPGMLKSPAMGEALKPIYYLEAEAAKNNEIAEQEYADGIDEHKLRKAALESVAKQTLKKDPTAHLDLNLDEPQKPTPVRYRTNDTSYESLGELLINNPAGILVERDELVSLLSHLDRDDQAVARGFYLSGWSGTQPYTFDRIVRGHRHVEAVCLSVLGNTQPARISEYVRRANSGGAGGDGMIQRFGLLVWPDASTEWKDADEYPNARVREDARNVFNRLAKLDAATAVALGAQKGPFDPLPFLRLGPAAHDDFLGWRLDLEHRLRSGEISPAIEGHLAKYRKLVPALALINHLADGHQGAISHKSMLRALAYANYLETHARRVYGASFEGERGAARAILRKIHHGELADGFSARDIQRHDWSGLTDGDAVQRGLDLLLDLHWIAPRVLPAGPKGGRPAISYILNPRGRR